jgi:hypothetical protein
MIKSDINSCLNEKLKRFDLSDNKKYSISYDNFKDRIIIKFGKRTFDLINIENNYIM